MAAQLVTVFGGSGFVGRHTVRALARAGYRVRVAIRKPHLAHFLRPMGDVGQIELVQANIRDEPSTRRALEDADAAVNLVGVLHEAGPQKFGALHDEGASRIAQLARDEGVARLVQMSAIGADPDSSSKYARSKAAGEAGVREAMPGAVIIRPSIVFGPEDQFFNRFAGLARMSPFLPLVGGGHTRFQPVFVGDVAAAIASSIAHPEAEGATYELGGPAVYTFRELMDFTLKESNRKRLLLPLPFGLAKFMGAFLGLLPSPLLTMDQVELLKSDNVVDLERDIRTLTDFGISPTAIEAVVPQYLHRFRRLGQFEEPEVV